jgi:hypothetical protein
VFKKTIFATLLILSGCSVGTDVPTVSLNLDWGPERWEGVPENIDKPTSEWFGKILKIRVVEMWATGSIIEEKNASASIEGNILTICYRQEPLPNPRHIVIRGAIAPVILNFTITKIPVQNYTIEVSHLCQ